jgi:hypothetical protein
MITRPSVTLDSEIHELNGIVKDMYLQINNISQGLNMGILVYTLTEPSFYGSFSVTYYCPPF